MFESINVVRKKLKHGIFHYFKNDIYIGRSLSEYGEWSEDEVRLIKQISKPEDNIIEIGSNIGTHTIPIAKHLSNKGFIYAIEPQPQNYKVLLKNINENNLNNVKTFKVGASIENGEAYINKFNESERDNFGDAKILKKKSSNLEKIIISTLDDLLFEKFNEIQKLNLIKCDAQGEEENIINGSKKLIEKFKPFLYVENEDINKSKNLIETIKSLDYLLFWHIVPLFNPKNYLNNSKNIFSNISSFNMLCIHKKTKIKHNIAWKKLEINDSDFHPLKNSK